MMDYEERLFRGPCVDIPTGEPEQDELPMPTITVSQQELGAVAYLSCAQFPPLAENDHQTQGQIPMPEKPGQMTPDLDSIIRNRLCRTCVYNPEAAYRGSGTLGDTAME